MADFVVGIGANLGDRLATLQTAVGRLSLLGRLEAISALYETEPIGGPAQPLHLNAAVRLNSELAPLALLAALQRIELDLGRVRHERWGPRMIDLDLLWAEGPTVVLPALEIPHPRLHERVFALRPLLDVAPNATDPRTGRPYASMIDELADQGVRRVTEHWVTETRSGS